MHKTNHWHSLYKHVANATLRSLTGFPHEHIAMIAHRIKAISSHVYTPHQTAVETTAWTSDEQMAAPTSRSLWSSLSKNGGTLFIVVMVLEPASPSWWWWWWSTLKPCNPTWTADLVARCWITGVMSTSIRITRDAVDRTVRPVEVGVTVQLVAQRQTATDKDRRS